MRRVVLAVLGAAILAACGSAKAAVPPALPARLLPAALNGLQVQDQPSARGKFNVPDTLVTQGRLYTLRLNDTVEGALEVGLLSDDIDTRDVDQQQSIRRQVGSGAFRYYRVAGQWIGEEDTPDDRVFLWFPDASPGVFEVLFAANTTTRPQDLLASIIRYQEAGS